MNIKCYVHRRPNLRTFSIEMESYMGKHVLDAIFDRMEYMPELEKIFFSFPERWLNIVEQRSLIQRLEKYCPNLKELEMKTHSVYIVQTIEAKNVLIVKGHGDSDELPQENVEGKLYTENVQEIFNQKGLTVLGQ